MNPPNCCQPGGHAASGADGPNGKLDRRSFLRKSTVLASGLAAIAASLAPLRELTDLGSVDEFLQKHYKELAPAEMEKALERIRKEVEKQYGIRPHLRDLKPMDGVEFVYCLNLTRCIGCRKCVRRAALTLSTIFYSNLSPE
jgi:molybdopterin-containing oxidoreductase family iron-sulfur binding subunit